MVNTIACLPIHAYAEHAYAEFVGTHYSVHFNAYYVSFQCLNSVKLNND